jgi:hypothetical protein
MLLVSGRPAERDILGHELVFLVIYIVITCYYMLLHVITCYYSCFCFIIVVAILFIIISMLLFV